MAVPIDETRVHSPTHISPLKRKNAELNRMALSRTSRQSISSPAHSAQMSRTNPIRIKPTERVESR